jgi:cell division septal protein FtsQ
MRRPRPANHRQNAAVERAVRAATEPEPWLPPGFAAWVIARVLGLGLLVGAGWLVYDCGSSDRFQVRSVHVQGNVLLSRAEIDGVAAVSGANIFWVDRNQVAARLRALPLVQHVEIDATLPDTVDISILERQPVAFWLSGEQSYLVDGEGVILKAVDPETQSARACAGQPCDPRLAPLPSVVQVDGQPLAPGDRVDASALAASASLTSLLPTLGVQPIGFEWSRDAGLEVPTRDGWRVRFDDGSSIEEQLASLRAIRDQLAQTQTSASLIDLRFGDRPYFR